MDYEGVMSDVFSMRERAKFTVREWRLYPWFNFSDAGSSFTSFIWACDSFMRQLHTDGKTEKIVFE